MAGPQTITGLTLLQLSNLSYAALIITDAQGNMAAGTTPFYQTPGGLLLPGKADGNGYPIHAAEGSAPQGSGTITVSSTNTATTLSASVGSLAFGAGLFDAKQATVRLYNNGTGETITAVSLSLSDTVDGQVVAVTYSQTVSLASGSTQALVFPLTDGIGTSATISVTFGTAPTAGSVAMGVDWQSAGAANTAITGSLVQQQNTLLPNTFDVLMIGGADQGYAQPIEVTAVPVPDDILTQAYLYGFLTDSAMRGEVESNQASAGNVVQSWQGLRLSNGTSHRVTSDLAAAGNVVVWTPSSGHAFRLLGGMVSSNAATVLTFYDETTPILDLVFAGAGSQPITLPLNGIMSAAIGNTLNVTSSAAATIYATAIGMEN